METRRDAGHQFEHVAHEVIVDLAVLDDAYGASRGTQGVGERADAEAGQPVAVLDDDGGDLGVGEDRAQAAPAIVQAGADLPDVAVDVHAVGGGPFRDARDLPVEVWHLIVRGRTIAEIMRSKITL